MAKEAVLGVGCPQQPVKDGRHQGFEAVVAGRNAGWKERSSMGREQNRRFHSVPHAAFIEMLRHKQAARGVMLSRSRSPTPARRTSPLKAHSGGPAKAKAPKALKFPKAAAAAKKAQKQKKSRAAKQAKAKIQKEQRKNGAQMTRGRRATDAPASGPGEGLPRIDSTPKGREGGVMSTPTPTGPTTS